MARIALKQPAAAIADHDAVKPETGWRSGSSSRDRTKLRTELLRLEEIVLRQGNQLEGYAALYQRLLKYFTAQELHAEANRLSIEVGKVRMNAWSSYRMKGPKA